MTRLVNEPTIVPVFEDRNWHWEWYFASLRQLEATIFRQTVAQNTPYPTNNYPAAAQSTYPSAPQQDYLQNAPAPYPQYNYPQQPTACPQPYSYHPNTMPAQNYPPVPQYNAQQPGYPPAQHNYWNPDPYVNYGQPSAHPQQPHYGAPPQPNYGVPYGSPQLGYGAPPNAYGAPQGAYGSPQPNQLPYGQPPANSQHQPQLPYQPAPTCLNNSDQSRSGSKVHKKERQVRQAELHSSAPGNNRGDLDNFLNSDIQRATNKNYSETTSHHNRRVVDEGMVEQVIYQRTPYAPGVGVVGWNI